ncbi:MAG: DNA-binding protein [Candidatus Eremiobacteraeota bacterium]|jgi:transcriptional regulator with XRE-family HTH domain|nr:DNA-binding protein [Candidatus Eremiobacteraeota bacterium]
MNLSRRRTLPQGAEPRPELAVFLRFLRQRIDPDVRDLGPYERFPGRLGKAVSQQELAEAIGVSREWYAALESAVPHRTSASLIDRLADVLMVTAEERGRLFRLAVPELGRTHLRDDSIAAVEAFARLRSLSRRLFVATSADDVLTTASEQIAEWSGAALLVRSTRRHESGLWESRSVDEKQDRSKVAKVMGEFADGVLLTMGSRDGSNLYSRLVNAGDVGTPDLWPLAVQREAQKACAHHRVAGIAGLYARVQSRTGFTGALYTAHELGQHSHTASDIAVLGAVAELASLALS